MLRDARCFHALQVRVSKGVWLWNVNQHLHNTTRQDAQSLPLRQLHGRVFFWTNEHACHRCYALTPHNLPTITAYQVGA